MCLTMPEMTAKTLSWATFGLLLSGSIPFVSNPEFVAATQPGASGTPPNPVPLPSCGECNISPTLEYQKPYAIDLNALCSAPTAYRIATRLASKIICTNGSFWVCEDTSSLTCGAFLARPSCPQDTCKR